MRLFFALWPDAETRARAEKAAGALLLSPAARLVPRESFHVTLAFLGEANAAQLEILRRIGSAQQARGCTLRFDIHAYWPQPLAAVAIARKTPAALSELRMRLHRDLASEPSLNLDTREWPWRPHVTLARKVAQAPVPQAMSPFSWRARHFSLIRSDTSAAHSVYTVVDTWPLLDKRPKPSQSL